MTQKNKLDINNQEQNKGKLTHFNEAGEAHMVDVHAKDDTYRVAKACGTIKVNGAVYRAVSTGTAKKGDVLARLYAGDAAKFAAAEEKFHSALTFAARRPQLPALVLARVDKDGVTRF